MPVLPLQPWMIRPESRRVMTALGEARFIGGCVRDALLGLPVSDLDIATPHPPDEVTRRLAAAGVRVIPTGIAHGTVTALSGGRPFEITTLRRDLVCDGRHAEVAFTDDWQADASRRDFTINALSCTLDGDLFDPFGGLEDLAARRLRFIGCAEDRIREDVLRLLRYFRFFARYGGEAADAGALAACRALAPLLPGLSGERVRTELFRLLTGPRPAEVWALLAGLGIVPHLLPGATQGERLARLVALDSGLGLGGAERALPRLAALLDGPAAALPAVAGRLRLSGAERRRLLALAASAAAVDPAAAPGQLCRQLAALGDEALFLDSALLSAATSESWPDCLHSVQAVLAGWRRARFPLGGLDVLAAGVAPGPEVGRLLAALRDWWAGHEFGPGRAECCAELNYRIAKQRFLVTAAAADGTN
ncbi:MAG: CCA tRNA nucleotidyltransferase [Rhodospirillaceae bacterium]